MILSSLAYITPIRLSFCISTGERESYPEGGRGRERERERENFCKEKKKKIQNRSNDFTFKYMIKNDKKNKKRDI